MDENRDGVKRFPMDSIDLSQDGVMTVTLDLKRERAEIIALGLLEKAKQAASAWIYQQHLLSKEIAKARVSQQKWLIDRLMRRNNGV